MAHTKILLRQDIADLGARGEIVRVRAGYARNYLLPRKLAVEATTSNVKQIQQERTALLKREASERSAAESQADRMRSLVLTFERKAGEQGALYGSVTSMDIAEALQERGFETDRHRIHLREPIKRLGDFNVPLRLHREVSVDLQVIVRSEGEVILGHMTPEQEASAAMEKSGEESAGGAE